MTKRQRLRLAAYDESREDLRADSRLAMNRPLHTIGFSKICWLFAFSCLAFSAKFGYNATAFLISRPSRILSATSSLNAGKNKGQAKKKISGVSSFVNRIAYRNYEILDTLEAGIALKGTEVKAIRDGKLNLRDGFIRPTKDRRSCELLNVHIGKHAQAGPYFQHEERRPRRLLLHKAQARKWAQQVDTTTGLTMVPLKAYFNEDNLLKLQIALCRGKNVRDKRADIQERDQKREANRIIKSFRAGV